jgi:hypothetical protein
MKAKIIYASLVLAIILVLGGVYVFRGSSAESIDYEFVISRPETAIAIARALLSEHYSELFRYGYNFFEDYDFTAEKTKDVWIVRTVLPSPVAINENEMLITFGVSYYVHIRSNGEILRIGF